jgi:hypothetical protein
MTAEELRDAQKRQPFEPFRLVMTDDVGYDIPHPDLLLVGRRTATVGLTGQPGKTFYERTVKIDLMHVIRLEPLESFPSSGPNGSSSPGSGSQD